MSKTKNANWETIMDQFYPDVYAQEQYSTKPEQKDKLLCWELEMIIKDLQNILNKVRSNNETTSNNAS